MAFARGQNKYIGMCRETKCRGFDHVKLIVEMYTKTRSDGTLKRLRKSSFIITSSIPPIVTIEVQSTRAKGVVLVMQEEFRTYRGCRQVWLKSLDCGVNGN